jgi:hypothetical protein
MHPLFPEKHLANRGDEKFHPRGWRACAIRAGAASIQTLSKIRLAALHRVVYDLNRVVYDCFFLPPRDRCFHRVSSPVGKSSKASSQTNLYKNTGAAFAFLHVRAP